MSLLIKNGYVVTMNPRREVFAGGFVAVDGKDIAAVGPKGAEPQRRFDEVVDAAGLRIAVDDLHRGIRLVCVPDGEACMDYLQRRAGFESAERPDLILLDLRMPRMSGFEVLRAISAAPELKQIPVVVLTTSSAERDIEEAYRLGCKSYILKPLGYGEFASSIARLCDYWFDLNRAPELERTSNAPDDKPS